MARHQRTTHSSGRKQDLGGGQKISKDMAELEQILGKFCDIHSLGFVSLVIFYFAPW